MQIDNYGLEGGVFDDETTVANKEDNCAHIRN